MRAVNLLPRESHGRHGSGGRRVDPFVAGGAALTVVVAVALGGGFALEHSHASSAQRKLASARAELARLQSQQPAQTSGSRTPTLPTPTVLSQQAPWQTALTAALASRVAWDDLLSQLARVVPAKVTVTTVTLDGAGSSTSTSSTGSLSLGGTAFSEQGVVQLLSRLQLVPALSDVAIGPTSADPTSGVVTWTLTAAVSPATVPSTAPSSGVAS